MIVNLVSFEFQRYYFRLFYDSKLFKKAWEQFHDDNFGYRDVLVPDEKPGPFYPSLYTSNDSYIEGRVKIVKEGVDIEAAIAEFMNKFNLPVTKDSWSYVFASFIDGYPIDNRYSIHDAIRPGTSNWQASKVNMPGFAVTFVKSLNKRDWDNLFKTLKHYFAKLPNENMRRGSDIIIDLELVLYDLIKNQNVAWARVMKERLLNDYFKMHGLSLSKLESRTVEELQRILRQFVWELKILHDTELNRKI